MTSRITRAILLVAGLLVLALGVPLAISVQGFYEDRAVVDLQRRAAETTAEISLPLDVANLRHAAVEEDAPGPFSVYDTDGRRVYGAGPARADHTVRLALKGDPATQRGPKTLVVATPIPKRVGEGVVGVMRVAEPTSTVEAKTRRAWLAMVAVVGVAFAIAVAVARAQARRLAAPIARLAERAEALGAGDFTSRVEPSGIEEIDTVAQELDRSGVRLAEILARERAFSADVSHQLRTPLAGLRLRLEHAAERPDVGDAVAGALVEVDRLQATVEHLLALARDAQSAPGVLPIDEVVDAVRDRWLPRFATAGRPLSVDISPPLNPARGSAVSMGQVLDVLLDNALRHGAGPVVLTVRSATGGLVLEVVDAGPGIAEDHLTDVFTRRNGEGEGIGLGLARTITEADGGRLLLVSGRPPRFQVVLPGALRSEP